MEFDRNRRPQYGRYSNEESGGGNRGGNNRGGGGGGFRGGNRGGGNNRGGGGNYESRQDDAVYSEKVRAGKRRTYFFDVRQTRGEDYFLTITESTKRSDGYGHTRHKLFLYKEDFNRFAGALENVINKVKTELMPDFDYEEFDRRQAEWESTNLDAEGNYIGTPYTEGDDTAAKKEASAEVETPTTPTAPTAPAAEDGVRDPELSGEDNMEW